MAQFEKFFPKLMESEGGFVNDPDDRGGATKWGVTLLEWIKNGYDKNGDGIIDEKDIMLLTQADAIRIAKPLYWDLVKGDQIISQSIAELLCDFAYNSGVVTSIKKLQLVLKVKDDGIIGSQTLTALNSGCQKDIFEALKQTRIDYVNAIVRNHPSQKKFLKGWLKRIKGFSFKAIAVILFAIFFASCRSTESLVQRDGFKPWPKNQASGYEQCTRNYIGYGTYQPPRRRGVDK